MLSIQEIILRLGAALLLSGIVGLQRSLSGQSAGMRTHILVGVGSALFTLVSAYAFTSVPSSGDRIAAQIVTGIGFIGGGAILKEHGSIKGLTTAAGLWTAAGLGMAAGAGLYALGATATVMIVLTLILLRYVELNFPRRARRNWRISFAVDNHVMVQRMYQIITSRCRNVILLSISQDGDTQAAFSAEAARSFDISALTAELHDAGARTVTCAAEGDADVER